MVAIRFTGEAAGSTCGVQSCKVPAILQVTPLAKPETEAMTDCVLSDLIVIFTGTVPPVVEPGPLTTSVQLTWVAPAGTMRVAVPLVPETVPVQSPDQPTKVEPFVAVPVRSYV